MVSGTASAVQPLPGGPQQCVHVGREVLLRDQPALAEVVGQRTRGLKLLKMFRNASLIQPNRSSAVGTRPFWISVNV